VNTITGKELTKILGLAIKDLRTQRSLTQFQLAEKLNIENESVSRLETGSKSLTLDRLCQLASVLDCEVIEFFKPLFQVHSEMQVLKIAHLIQDLTIEEQNDIIKVFEAIVKLLKKT
jgi:transcriptional regulator with XRE-family HTH domain